MSERIIVTSDAGQKTIENINPAVNNAKLAQFGSMLTGLTTNTYQKTDRITKVNCDTEPGGGTLPEPTLTLGKTTETRANVINSTGADGGVPFDITTNSDGTPYVRFANNGNGIGAAYAAGTFINSQNQLRGFVAAPGDSTTTQSEVTVYFGVLASANYAAKEVAFTITNS